MPITTPVDDVLKVIGAIKAVTESRVLVGVPSDEEQPHLGTSPIDPNERRDTPGGISNAALAYIHNFGSPANNIPQREFMASGIKNGQTQIESYLKQAATASLSGDLPVSDRALHAAGLAAQNAVRAKIMDGPFAPLAESTIRRRRAKAAGGAPLSAADIAAGFSDVRPLIDTAQMRNSISYVVRKGK